MFVSPGTIKSYLGSLRAFFTHQYISVRVMLADTYLVRAEPPRSVERVHACEVITSNRSKAVGTLFMHCWKARYSVEVRQQSIATPYSEIMTFSWLSAPSEMPRDCWFFCFAQQYKTGVQEKRGIHTKFGLHFFKALTEKHHFFSQVLEYFLILLLLLIFLIISIPKCGIV